MHAVAPIQPSQYSSAMPANAIVLSVLILSLLPAACSRPGREYELKGQVVAVDQARQEITIKHEDIPHFMPGMTMAFRVRQRRLLEGRVPGDLVKATLVVGTADAYLRTLERTGFTALTEPATPTHVMDLLAQGQAVRDATLLDEHGRRRRLADWRGDVLAVTFMYTRCPLPNFCPLMDRHFKAVQNQIRDDASLRGRVQLLSVSFDPDHDTPAVLAKRAAEVNADPAVWHFMTGSPEEVARFSSQFGISLMREDPRESEIVHNLRTAVIAGDGRLTAILRGNEWTPSELVAELRHARAGR
jgi:protein SCO1